MGGGIQERIAEVFRGRSQTEMARVLGVSQRNISRYVTGAMPGPEFLRALAEVECVDVGWLLTGKPTPIPESPIAGKSSPADLTNASTEDIVKELSKRVRMHVDQATEMLDLARKMQRQIDKLESDEAPKEP
jgi:transcriptional regulator with XRE-family HTH domain